MPPSYDALKVEVTTDPLGIGYAGKSDEQVADLLNAPTQSRRQPIVARASIKNYVLGVNKLGAILIATTPSARLCQAMFADPDYSALNLDDPIFQALLSGLVSESLLMAGDVTAITALGNIPTSRAINLAGWGIPVQAPDITWVRTH